MAFSSNEIKFEVNNTLLPNAMQFMVNNERNGLQLKLCDIGDSSLEQ